MFLFPSVIPIQICTFLSGIQSIRGYIVFAFYIYAIPRWLFVRHLLYINNTPPPPPNDQTQNIVDNINDSHLQMRELKESIRSSDIDDISRPESLSELKFYERQYRRVFQHWHFYIGINTTNINDSSHTEDQSCLQHVWSENESSFFYTNADSLLNKRDELALIISTNKYDIVVVTEVLPKNRTSSNINDERVPHKWVPSRHMTS